MVSRDWVVARLDCLDSLAATRVAAEWLDQVSKDRAVLSCRSSRGLDASMSSSEACADYAASGESDPCSLDFAFILGLACVTNDAIADLSLEKYHLRHSWLTEQTLLSSAAKRTTYTIARKCPHN